MNKQKRGRQGEGGGRPRLSETKQRITISIAPNQKQALTQYALTHHITESEAVRRAIQLLTKETTE